MKTSSQKLLALARTMQGSWAVEPVVGESDRDASLVSMAFAFQPKTGIAGRLFVPMMHLMFRPTLRRILNGWERTAV